MTPLLIIDPGHGGIDPGGGSTGLFTEKEMALAISLHQYRRFRELGIPVALTRDRDITLNSEERAAIVRNSGARYCLSNHINAGGGRGAEAIYSIHASPALPRALLEELEAAGMPTRRLFTRTLPNNPNLDYYYMHRETGKVETVILEYGFADNPIDAEKIQRDWQVLSEAVVRAFAQFVQHPYTPPAPAPSPGTGELPAFKREGIDWLYEQGLLTDDAWRSKPDEPLPLWAEALVLKRLWEKLQS